MGSFLQDKFAGAEFCYVSRQSQFPVTIIWSFSLGEAWVLCQSCTMQKLHYVVLSIFALLYRPVALR